MGVAIDALADVWTFLKHNPIILGAGWAGALLLSVANFVLGLIPLLGRLVSLFLFPVFLTGMLGLIYGGRNGNASLSDAVDSVSDYYIRILGASVIIGIILTVLGIGGLLVTVFTASFGSGMGQNGSPFAAVMSMLLPLVVVGIVVFLIYTVFQFFDVAIIVNDASLLESFKTSMKLVISAPLSVLGYTLLRVGIGLTFFVAPIVGIASVLGGVMSLGTAGAGAGGVDSLLGAAGILVIALVAVWFLVLIPVGHILSLTYHVAFFNRHSANGTV